MRPVRSIGNFTPKNPFFLAPMEAVNCASFRLVCKHRGAGLVYTDMIDADIFVDYAKKHSVQAAIDMYVNPQKDELPLSIQLGGGNAENLVFCIKHLSKYATLFDYNIGCPLSYMTGKKGGVYLMKHPNILYKIVQTMRDAIKCPFTCKIRSGWDSDLKNADEVAEQLEACGIDALAFHGRTGKQGYRDRADWALARKIRDRISIPLILSGDVFTPYDAFMAFAHTKCDFVMLARGARANPSVFVQLNKWNEAGATQPVKADSTYDKSGVKPFDDFVEFLELYKTREKRYKFSELQDHALWTAIECKGNTEVKKKILDAKTEDELLAILKKCVY